jgi:hypothetical protein
MIADDIIKIMELNKNILCQFIGNMDDMEINNRIKDYWTIYEHLEHLTMCQNILLHRIKQFIKEDNPVIKPYRPENGENNNEKYSVKGLLEKYCGLREEQILLIKDVNKDIWEKDGKHEEYKRYTFEILVRHIILHDSFHMYRMEELWIGKEEYIKPLE